MMIHSDQAFCGYRLFKVGALTVDRWSLTRGKRPRFWISPALSGHLERNRRLKVCKACSAVKQKKQDREKRAGEERSTLKECYGSCCYEIVFCSYCTCPINHWPDKREKPGELLFSFPDNLFLHTSYIYT